LLSIVLGPCCCPFRFSWLCSRLSVTSGNRPLLRHRGGGLHQYIWHRVVLSWCRFVSRLRSNLLRSLWRLGAPLVLNLGPDHGSLLWSRRSGIHLLCCSRLRCCGSVGRLRRGTICCGGAIVICCLGACGAICCLGHRSAVCRLLRLRLLLLLLTTVRAFGCCNSVHLLLCAGFKCWLPCRRLVLVYLLAERCRCVVELIRCCRRISAAGNTTGVGQGGHCSWLLRVTRIVGIVA